MSAPTSEPATLVCHACLYTAPPGDDWDVVEVAGVGTMTRCPECGSTQVEHKR
jgi:Zn finger protein HypA/HybF involved in hydrogenase expression